ncbi:hypothetical protein G3A_20805 [Bacillus sp. 17376]|nr:hypothetical protein G3A_20805 [Bacillus sp. 17376]
MSEVVAGSAKIEEEVAANVRSSTRFGQNRGGRRLKCPKQWQVRPKWRRKLQQMSEVAPGSAKIEENGA